MNKQAVNILKWLLVILLAVFVIVQIYSGFVNPITTDTVYTYSAYSGYETVGFIVRNETVIQRDSGGVLSYEIADGGRVAKNGTIAEVYADASMADKKIRIQELDKRIATLQKIQTYNDLNAADLTSINSTIHNCLTEIAHNTQNGKVKKGDYTDILLENMARKQIITGQATDFNSLIATLKSERDRLAALSVQSLGLVTSPQSGYVIYSVDGYENALSVTDIETLTAEKLGQIKQNAVPDNALCKIVSDYEWYIAVTIPFEQSLKLNEGSTVKLKTTLLSIPELAATVKYINKQSVGSDAVVVFSCDTMNNELAKARRIDITVVFEQYDGLKVDKRAIRMVDGVKGVYVLLASQVKFIKIEEIWSNENYCIVKQEVSNNRVLRIYDEIIVKGKNLYDGKIIS